MLLAPELAPVTFSIGFLEAPLDVVASGVRAWYAEADIERALRPASALPFAAAVEQLLPLAAPDFRRLWLSTASPRWRTAYLDGFVNGTDAFPPVGYLAERLGCHGLVVGAQPQSARCYGATHIALYGPAPTEWLNVLWSVAARNDGGRWSFVRTGTAQPFEDMEAYTRRRVQDRLPLTLLRRYCEALEVPLDVAEYGPASILDVSAHEGRHQRRVTLAGARAELGLGDAGQASREHETILMFARRWYESWRAGANRR